MACSTKSAQLYVRPHRRSSALYYMCSAAQLVSGGGVSKVAAGLLILTNDRVTVPTFAHARCPHVSTWVVGFEGSVTAHHLYSYNAGIIPSDGPQSATAVPVIASFVASGRLKNRLITKLEV